MSFEHIAEGLRVMALGMGVVFAALLGLYLILVRFERYFSAGTGGSSSATALPAFKQAETAQPGTEDERRLIAVVSTAVASYLSSDPGQISVIRVTRVS